MLRKIIVVTLLLISLQNNFASSFQKGNLEFSNKNYRQAITLYLEDIQNNGDDVNTLFNLANSYLKIDEYGKALYTYYKARAIDPRDINIQKEIKALEKSLDLVDQYPYIFILTYIENWYFILILTLLISTVLLLSSFLKYTKKTDSLFYKLKKIIIIVLSVLLLLSVTENILQLKNKNSGIILIKKEVLISPYPGSDTSFTINEGTKVSIDENFNDFLFITDSSGRYGWIEKEYTGRLWKK